MEHKLFIISIILSIVSILAGFMGYNHWYYLAAISVWIFFDQLHSLRNENTTLHLLIHDKKKFVNTYLLMMSLAFSIECFGRFILGYWTYPLLTTVNSQIILFLFYPFILFSFREMYGFLKLLTPNKVLSFIISMILGIAIWEFPNLFAKDWIYKIPFTNYELFDINIVVLFAWSFLIFLPDFAYRQFVFPEKEK